MRPTRAGVALTILGFALSGLGWLVGSLDLYLLSAMAFAAVIMAFLLSLLLMPRVDISQTPEPPTLRVGNPARLNVVVHNRSVLPTQVTAAQTTIAGHKTGIVLIPPIASKKSENFSFALNKLERGLLEFGSVRLTYGDPLGLFRSTTKVSEPFTSLVRPRVFQLNAIEAVGGREKIETAEAARNVTNFSDEFFALRPYVVGDELRKVDWKATARTDEMVVRQHEEPKAGQVHIALDLAASNYDRPSFEKAISASLSALYSGVAGPDLVNFVTTSSGSSQKIRNRSEIGAIEIDLSSVQPEPSSSLPSLVESLNTNSAGGTLVVVTGKLTREISAATEKSLKNFGLVIVINCWPSPNTPKWVLPFADNTDFPKLWNYHRQRRSAVASGARQ